MTNSKLEPGEVAVIDFAIWDEPDGSATTQQVDQLASLRAVLLQQLADAGIAAGEPEQAQIQACTDAATLNRWSDNVLGAQSAGEVLS